MTPRQLYFRSHIQRNAPPGVAVFKKTRKRCVIQHRSIIIHILCGMKFNYREIAEVITNGTPMMHSTILYHKRVIEHEKRVYPEVKERVETWRKILNNIEANYNSIVLSVILKEL